jgi:DNA-binding SARP family transcriptional activator
MQPAYAGYAGYAGEAVMAGSAGTATLPASRLTHSELAVRLVGGFTVYRYGRVQTATEVGSRKARRLLALLAVEQGRLVGVDRLVEVLWEGAPPRHPAENVATLVSRLRTTLGPQAVMGSRSGYRLGDSVTVDLYDSVELVAEAGRQLVSGNHDHALSIVGRALTLLTGEVLEDERDAAWAAPARGIHAELLRRARHTGAEAAVQLGDLRTAESMAEAAVAADPLDEAAVRALMRTYAVAGEPARALGTFERLRTALASELGVDPARATRDLHVAILQDRVALRADTPDTPHAAGVSLAGGVGGLHDGLRPAPRGPVPVDAGFVRRHREVAQFVEAWAHAAADDERFLQPVLEALVQLVAGVAGLPASALHDAAERAGKLGTVLPDVRGRSAHGA